MSKMHHSKSTKIHKNRNEDSDVEPQRKVKHSKSVFFDPTTQVSTPFPDLIWKFAFHKLPRTPQLTATTLTSDEAMNILHCSLLSWAVYFKKSKRDLPPNLSNTIYECTVSDYYRIPYFVVDSEELDTIFIAFRGSACLEDWHVDFLAAAIKFEHGHVHEGVYFTALNIFNDFKDIIREFSKSRNNRKIVIVGHSLGGAVAGMMAILFNLEMSDLDVKAICLAPVACLSPEIWEMSKDYIRSYINYGDLVPFISYFNTYYLPENSLPKLTHDQLVHWCVKKINKHSKRPEFKSLVENYTEPLEKPYKLIPPGISCLIRIVDKKAARVEIQAIDDQFSYFGQFVKNLSAMKHPIKFYKHSIIRFVCQFFNQDEKLITYYSLGKKKRRIHNPFRRHKHHKHDKKNKEINENGEENESQNSSNYSSENQNTTTESSGNLIQNSNQNNNENRSDNENNQNESSGRTDSSSDDDDDENRNESSSSDDNDNQNKNRKSESSSSDDEEFEERYNYSNDNDNDDDDVGDENYYSYYSSNVASGSSSSSLNKH